MNLIEFLKTYTKINNNFIDDFFSLYDSKDKYNFSINIDIIAKWFEMRKDHIKKTLTESYIKNIDCTYVWNNGSIVTEWPIEYYPPEEKLERQNIIKDAFANNVGFTSWLWNEEECRFDPPTPKPNDGHNYNWDEPTTSWVRVV